MYSRETEFMLCGFFAFVFSLILIYKVLHLLVLHWNLIPKVTDQVKSQHPWGSLPASVKTTPSEVPTKVRTG